MISSAIISFYMVFHEEAMVNKFLGILAIIFAIGSCILYLTQSHKANSWYLTFTLYVLAGISYYLSSLSESNTYYCGIVCAVVGLWSFFGKDFYTYLALWGGLTGFGIGIYKVFLR